MANLTVECYGDINNDGNIPVKDKYLGTATISTLSTTGTNSTELPTGTKYVEVSSDATVRVYYTFGKGSATATTSHQALKCDLGQKIDFTGINDKNNDTIAARIA